MSIAYIEGDHHIYRGSSIGSCRMALAASLMGYEEARYDKTQTILDNAAAQGDLLEGHVLEQLAQQGYVISQRQMTLEIPVAGNSIIRGHTDGLASEGPGLNGPAGVEVKTMSKARYVKWKSFDDPLGSGDFAHYAWQASAYWRGLKVDHGVKQYVYAVFCRDNGELDVRVLDRPPVPWGMIVAKVLDVDKAVEADELPECDADAGAKYFCPFVML